MNKNLSLFLSAFIGVFGVLALAWNPPMAHAVPIEGQTPDGGYQAVAVSTAGALSVEIGTGTVVNVTISAPLPLPIELAAVSSNTAPVPVTFSTGTAIVAEIQTTTTSAVAYAQGSNSGSGAGFSVLPANSARHQSVVCNTCGMAGSTCAVNLWIGDSFVTTGTGFPLAPGTCYSPDNPASFVGQLFGASTATVTWAYITH